jgi:hypothetical protein
MPGGGVAIRFPTIPARTLATISYLIFPPTTLDTILAYVGSDDGPAKRIPVMLQRIWPQWYLRMLFVLLIAGIWVALNFVIVLVKFLWTVYYSR